jgi:lipoprotein NlpD
LSLLCKGQPKLALSLLLGTLACATAPQGPEPLDAVGPLEDGETTPPGTWHDVATGETLWRLAAHYQVTVQQMIDANAIADPTRLEVGRRVFIPLPPGSPLSERRAQQAAKPNALPAVSGPDKPPPGGFIWPLREARVLRRFAPKADDPSDGLELGAALGSPVRAVADGRVVFAAHDPRGWGNLLIVAHAGQWVSIYAHNKRNIAVEGAAVKQGEEVATVGQSGRAKTPRLHLELRRGVTPKDPQKFLPKLGRP